jgi:hypothetical protein
VKLEPPDDLIPYVGTELARGLAAAGSPLLTRGMGG